MKVQGKLANTMPSRFKCQISLDISSKCFDNIRSFGYVAQLVRAQHS